MVERESVPLIDDWDASGELGEVLALKTERVLASEIDPRNEYPSCEVFERWSTVVETERCGERGGRADALKGTGMG